MPSKELQAKAKWAADLARADGVKPEQLTDELALAYMDAIGRKISEIQGIYLTRNGGKQAMQQAVYALMQ